MKPTAMANINLLLMLICMFALSQAFMIEYPGENITEDSTNGIFVVWTATITDNLSEPVYLHLNQTAFDGARTFEGGGPIEMGGGKYTFASDAVTTSHYSLLVVAGDQQRYVESFRVSVNWTFAAAHSLSLSSSGMASLGPTTPMNSTTSSAGGTEATTTSPSAESTTDSASTNSEAPKNASVSSSGTASATSPTIPTPSSTSGGLSTDAKIAIGVSIGTCVLLIAIWAFFNERKSPFRTRRARPQIVELDSMGRIIGPVQPGQQTGRDRPLYGNHAELHGQPVAELE